MPVSSSSASFPTLSIPIDADRRKALDGVLATNTDFSVTWVHSYVTPDRHQTFYIHDAPTPGAIRKIAALNDLPVGKITLVSVPDPYTYGA